MATQSPFSFLDELLGKIGSGLKPPSWMVEEAQRRLVLTFNHVLQQEPEAQARLKRQAGRVIEAQWRTLSLRVTATPAGLLDLAGEGAAPPDLTLTLTEESPFQLAQAALRGDKPKVAIVGDVQLAAEVNWLVDNVRWDFEEDLSRVIGDAPAHTVGQVLRKMGEALRKFAARAPGAAGADEAPPPPPA
jgi:ubiquinone biosynthesis accessory factor UbiJ